MRVRGFKVAFRTEDGSAPPSLGAFVVEIGHIAREQPSRTEFAVAELEGKEVDRMLDEEQFEVPS